MPPIKATNIVVQNYICHILYRTHQETRFESVLSQSIGYSHNEVLQLVIITKSWPRKYVWKIKKINR